MKAIIPGQLAIANAAAGAPVVARQSGSADCTDPEIQQALQRCLDDRHEQFEPSDYLSFCEDQIALKLDLIVCSLGCEGAVCKDIAE